MEKVISDEFKLVYTQPLVEYEEVEADSYEQKVTTTDPDCVHVQYASASPSTLNSLHKSKLLRPIVREEEGMTVVDLQEWVEPFVSLRMEVDLAQFLIAFVQNNLKLLEENPDPRKVVASMPPSYSFIATSISFLKLLEYEDEDILEALDAHLRGKFPPILLLMNLNGFLVLRT